MTAKPCPQSGLIEALHDGRLGPVEAASCERHLGGCAECASLLEELTVIRAALRAPTPSPTPLEHQRARLGLLRAATGAPARPLPPRRWVLATGLLAATSALAGVATWRSMSTEPHPVPAPTPVQAPVPPAPPQETPTAAPEPAPLTTSPLPNLPAPPAADPPAPEVPDAPATQEQTSDLPGRGHPPAKSRSRATQRRASSDPAEPHPQPASPEPPESAATSQVGQSTQPAHTPAALAFAAAMAAYASGDFGLAAGRFAAFCAAHPGDRHAEEATFLVAKSLQRAGRAEEAQAAAERYLREFPRGTHRGMAGRMGR